MTVASDLAAEWGLPETCPKCEKSGHPFAGPQHQSTENVQRFRCANCGNIEDKPPKDAS